MADTDLVLAITSDDLMFHSGTRRWVLDHVFGIDPDTGGRRDLHLAAPDAGGVRLEIFDAQGHALRAESGDLVAVGSGDVDPDLLVARVTAVLDRAREHLEAHPELDVPASVVPRPTGSLPEVLAALEGDGATGRPARHVPRGRLREWLVETGSTVWSAAGRLAPSVAVRVAGFARRIPGLGGGRGTTGTGGGVLEPPVPPFVPPDGVPHNGGWFHNLMHRLRG